MLQQQSSIDKIKSSAAAESVSRYQNYMMNANRRDSEAKSLIMQSVYSRDYQAKPPRPSGMIKQTNLFSSLIGSMTDPPGDVSHSSS